jgi:hypothetical protein
MIGEPRLYTRIVYVNEDLTGNLRPDQMPRMWLYQRIYERRIAEYLYKLFDTTVLRKTIEDLLETGDHLAT